MKEGVGKPDKGKDGEEDSENHWSSEDETADGNSSNTDWDQDSDISFMKDTDEEIDTADIEEEDWIDKHEEQHRWSHGTDENSKNPMLDQNTQKDELDIGDEN